MLIKLTPSPFTKKAKLIPDMSQSFHIPSDQRFHERFDLNLQNGECNPHQMLVTRVNDITVGNQMIDAIVIYKPIADARDFKKVKAVLNSDGNGIVVMEPTIPSYLLEDVASLHIGEPCVKTENAHRVIATAIANKSFRAKRWLSTVSLKTFPALLNILEILL